MSFVNFLKFVTVQSQNRHVKGHMGKKRKIISLMDWKIIMFDYEVLKLFVKVI